jgi:hypothetical protein
LAALAIAAATGLAVSGMTLAHASPGPPRFALRVAGLHQAGWIVFEEWTRRSGGRSCEISSGDGTGEYPRRPLVIGAGRHWARFVFRTRRKPRRVEITAWRRLDSAGNPVGRGVELPVRLEPRRRDDGRVVAWRAFFSIDPPPDYFVDLYAKWRSVCGGPRHLLYRFHVAG